jgi:hypothetical protein
MKGEGRTGSFPKELSFCPAVGGPFCMNKRMGLPISKPNGNHDHLY